MTHLGPLTPPDAPFQRSCLSLDSSLRSFDTNAQLQIGWQDHYDDIDCCVRGTTVTWFCAEVTRHFEKFRHTRDTIHSCHGASVSFKEHQFFGKCSMIQLNEMRD